MHSPPRPSLTRRAVAGAAALAASGALALVPSSAAAQTTCRPPTTEHAFEELLDVAADDSPLEDEAWRIADEADARDAFEAPETLRRLDDLAVANGLAYDCSARIYRPVAGPDPRQAIEEGAPGVEDGEASPGPVTGPRPQVPPATPTPAGGPSTSTPASEASGAGVPAPVAAGSSGATAGPDGSAGTPADGSATAFVPGPDSAAGSPPGRARTSGGNGRSEGADRSQGGEVTVDQVVGDPGLPGPAPSGDGAVVALPGDPAGPSDLGPVAAWAALAASLTGAAVVAVAASRRRRGRLLA